MKLLTIVLAGIILASCVSESKPTAVDPLTNQTVVMNELVMLVSEKEAEQIVQDYDARITDGSASSYKLQFAVSSYEELQAISKDLMDKGYHVSPVYVMDEAGVSENIFGN